MRALLYYGGGVTLVGAGLVLIYLLFLASQSVRSLMRARRCQNLTEMAAKRQKEGNATEAVNLYMRAESAWALNRFSGSRDSWMRDLDLLAAIGTGLVRSVGREPGTCFADFNATIREMREVLRERRNFGVDGRKILPDVMVRWKAAQERLDDHRARLRDACHPRNIRRMI
jgi:hypothetical protein